MQSAQRNVLRAFHVQTVPYLLCGLPASELSTAAYEEQSTLVFHANNCTYQVDTSSLYSDCRAHATQTSFIIPPTSGMTEIVSAIQGGNAKFAARLVLLRTGVQRAVQAAQHSMGSPQALQQVDAAMQRIAAAWEDIKAAAEQHKAEEAELFRSKPLEKAEEVCRDRCFCNQMPALCVAV